MSGPPHERLRPLRTYVADAVDEHIAQLVAVIERVTVERDQLRRRLDELEASPTAPAPRPDDDSRAGATVQHVVRRMLDDARAEAERLVGVEPRGPAHPVDAGRGGEPEPDPGQPDREQGARVTGTGRLTSVLADLEEQIDAIRSRLDPGPPAGGGGGAPAPRDDAAPAAPEGEDSCSDRPPAGRRPTGEESGDTIGPGQLDGLPSWVQEHAAGARNDIDYFAELRRALADGEPLGPREDGTRLGPDARVRNGAR